MYQHILVPLDGSTTAEQALDAASHVAEASTARVTLLAVVAEAPASRIEAARPAAGAESQGRAYLQELMGRMRGHTFPVDVHVARGAPTREIVDYAQQHGVDLIVLCTHGATADARYSVGSVAWGVLQLASCPVLMIRATL